MAVPPDCVGVAPAYPAWKSERGNLPETPCDIFRGARGADIDNKRVSVSAVATPRITAGFEFMTNRQGVESNWTASRGTDTHGLAANGLRRPPCLRFLGNTAEET